jgi:hypothetical protein
MLLRIAPDMFTDERYECKTIREVHDEIVRTTKFKSKYPWTRQMRAKVKAVVLSKERKQTEKVFFETVRTLNYEGGVNQKTERLIDVSREDMRVISHAPALEFQKTSEMILERVPPGSSLTPIPPPFFAAHLPGTGVEPVRPEGQGILSPSWSSKNGVSGPYRAIIQQPNGHTWTVHSKL